MIDKNTFGSKTALFHTFGCKLNFAETSTVARIFASKGIQRVHEGDVPDYVVINSCSVTDIADKNAVRQSDHSRVAILMRELSSQAVMHSLNLMKSRHCPVSLL